MYRVLFLASSIAALSVAASAAETPANTVEAVTVQARDPAGLLERQPDATVFGLDKALLDTGRQASFASAETLQRYGVQSINDLVAVAPGAFTDSYYGVAGALNLRGTLAETYFRGFKRIENRGTYPTPLGAADRIEVVRGPATPAMGPGKVGGFLNFTPKTTRREHGFLDRPTGDVEIEGGSYGHQRLTADLGAPVKLGTAEGGVFAYAEVDDSHSYYHGIYPRHQLAQLAADLDLGDGWSTGFGGMVYHSDGNVQTPGWNRVTPSLIDSGQYQAGRNAALVDSNGDGRLGHAEADAGASPGAGLITAFFGFTPATDPRFKLTSGVRTVTLSPRTVFVSPADFSRTDTTTLYWDLNKALGEGQALKLQLFYDDLKNKRFVSYGFPADYDARVVEGRLGWTVARTYGEVKTETLLGAALRVYGGQQKESFNGGYLSLDRRDLSQGPSATDIFADPFHDATVPWETRVVSRWRDAGLFGVTDIRWRSLDLTVGGRYDDFHVVSRDDGTLVFGAAAGRSYRKDTGDGSYSATLTWHAPMGLMPYVTTARTASLELGQAGGVAPSLVGGTNWLTASTLSEAGVKLRAFDDSLTGSFGVYRQTRTRLEQGNAVTGTKGQGVELELRWLATRNLSFTFAGNLQRTTVLGPDNGFIVIPPAAVGVSGINGYGGAYAVYSVAQLRSGNYDQSLIPHAVTSLYAVYTTDRASWGRAGATLGATSVSRTASILPGGFVPPAYVTVNASGFVEHGPWRVSANIDNLADARFFTPVADVYANVAALPGVGRTWRIALKRSY
jgi:iron complex outermembrane receptor protein